VPYEGNPIKWALLAFVALQVRVMVIAAGVTNATAWLMADKHDDETIER
jgi:hypothetical protein